MELIQEHSILQAQNSVRHLVIPALQTVTVDEAVGQRHDVRVHAILEAQVDDSLGCSSDRRRKSDASRPPMRASAFLTCALKI